MINYSDDQDKGYADNWHGSEKNNCFLPTPSGASFFGIPLTVNRSQGYFCGELELPGKLFVYDNTRIEAAGFHVLERESWRSSARIDYDLENDWSITSITAYNTFNDLQILDAGTTQFFRAGNNPSFSGAYTGRSDWSQELKVFSPQDESFSGFAGVYYYEENDDDGFLTSLQTATGLFDPATNSPSDVITNPFLEASSVRNWAVFGHIDIDMTDDWTFSAEARYQEDRITADGDTDGVIDLPALVDQQETFTAFLPRVSVSYKGIEDWNLYAAIAKGNRPGGFNILPSSATAASRAQFIADGFGTFDEDTVWSYELGAKGAFLDGRATLESAAFWLDWSNQQLTNGIPYDRVGTSPTTFATIVNAGQSRIRGFEADFNFAATDQFSFRVGYSYNDAEIRDFNDSVTEDLFDTDGLVGDADLAGDPSGQLRGNKLPQTPAHMLIVSGSYTQPVTDDIDAFFRADMSYESKRYVQVHNLAHTGDSYNLNLRAGVESDAWTVTVFLNNALNDKTPLVGTRLLDFTSTLLIPDPVTSFIFLQNRRFTFERDFRLGMPRKQAWGVTATYKF